MGGWENVALKRSFYDAGYVKVASAQPGGFKFHPVREDNWERHLCRLEGFLQSLIS